MTLLIIFLCIVALILLITWGKVNPFLAFLVVSIVTGLLLGIPLNDIPQSVNKGIGDMLGSLVVVIVLGAMLGKLVADSGAAQRIASVLMKIFGVKYIQWALMLTGFIIGIPLFYNVGFVLIVPLIFSVAYQYKLPAVYIGLPMLASLSVTHGFLPPHPSPAALVVQFNANMGLTLIYGVIVAIPAVIIAGPVFSRSLKKIEAKPLESFRAAPMPEDQLPGTLNSLLSSLLPVLLLIVTTLLLFLLPGDGPLKTFLTFIGEPTIVMLITIIIATFSLGRRMGMSMQRIMGIYAEAVKDVAMVLLIVSGAGILKQVFVDSGVSTQIATALQGWNIPPLVLAWLIAAVIRLALGSATVAGLTTAGIIAPVTAQLHVDPSLMVLSIGAGSLFFSHVNDAGFWLFKEYFNVSLKDTFRSWSLMETIVSVVGLLGVLILHLFV
ncbi:gluconate:H+ symporter [Chitinophaga japonensis]|uniref:Gnt-I system high-affinity gluconate transporter n=1 Tax=Chitinophaga japonensis TaxID=104662 RepID=A0A562T854_CHIJA|nr:gluconate:H+ symporter [Chitinophaga japonensis]TWI89314.1 Gnt-I system high-affinity gluconate transporter [Chitinophaga japonensis]